MGKLTTILTAILCSASPIVTPQAAEPKTEQVRSNFVLGSETISSIRASYQKGAYKAFFGKMDGAYQEAKAANGLDGLVQMRQKDVPEAFQEEWEKQFSELQAQKNQDLLGAISESDQSVFAKKVRSVASNPSTAEQEKAVSYMNNLVLKAPESGKNDEENRLIAIDLEYEYKLLHAVLPQEDLSSEKRQEYQIALRMEKMDKMVEAAKTFQNHDLKKIVGLAAANLDARLSRNLDGADLNARAMGSLKPSNEVEARVVSLLQSYQAQFNDLMKQIADANHS